MNDIEKTRLQPAWKELVKAAAKWGYGSFHTHDEIADILGVRPRTSKYYSHVQKARKRLIAYGKLLESIKDEGYQTVEVERYTEVTHGDIEKSRKYLKLGLIKTQYAPVELMSEEDRQKSDRFLVTTVGLLSMTESSYTELTKIVSPIPSRFQIKEAKPGEKNESD